MDKGKGLNSTANPVSQKKGVRLEAKEDTSTDKSTMHMKRKV